MVAIIDAADAIVRTVQSLLFLACTLAIRFRCFIRIAARGTITFADADGVQTLGVVFARVDSSTVSLIKNLHLEGFCDSLKSKTKITL